MSPGVVAFCASSPMRGHLFTGKALDLLAVEEYVAFNRRHQAAEGAQQGRLAAAVRADNRREMAVRNVDG